MGRPFILATAAASMLMFAGVWTATAPEPVAAMPEPAVPVAAIAAMAPERPASAPRIGSPRSAEATAPYNVVRSPYGDTHQVSRRVGTDNSVYYAGCREARAAGATPLHRGSPGYREGMDGDGDGVACEGYRH
ncbi:excalibur calcium-binding domain-containing protein [Sphingomonas faeni]|uniref:excalibur calcium-binding domain-containing protein n=1 Tax=Sphingomonas faeni TaxID=185950 RepID=UPI00335C0DAC